MILVVMILLGISLIIELNLIDLASESLVADPLFPHFIACLILSLAAQMFLKSYFKQVNWSFSVFIFLLTFFIPLWGILIGFFVVFTLFHFRKQFYKHSENLDNSINIQQLKPINPLYGEGGAIRSLLYSSNTYERTEALIRLGQFADVNKIMYRLLADEADEIRLLAFNILEQQERFISEDIEQLLNLLETEELSEAVRAKFEKNLALHYWELVYRHLIFNELERSIIEKALSYALSALRVLPEDATLWVLLGKIFTRLKSFPEAEAAFNKTTFFNVPPSQVLPYLAEIKYNQRDYLAVKKYLDSDVLLDVSLIAPVKYFWDKG
ncbi:MAG: hypothetical protein P4L79_09670 [Legionella sp.]|uniref:hypothetical protein n=1 Tax=Legionella sp. TaxID=459 RepID=UPI002844FDC0|nr:hypothetical protein [Legionella sp.]